MDAGGGLPPLKRLLQRRCLHGLDHLFREQTAQVQGDQDRRSQRPDAADGSFHFTGEFGPAGQVGEDPKAADQDGQSDEYGDEASWGEGVDDQPLVG